jgi:hypothetical protein
MPGDPDKQGRDDRRAEDDAERGAGEVRPCRHPGKLRHNDLDAGASAT